MRRLFCSLAILMALSSPAFSKNIVVIRGIFGDIVSPMTSIINGLRARGHSVDVREWWMGIPSKKYDIAIVHSAGDVPGLTSRAKKVITIDPTFLNPGCQGGSTCTNYYAFIDRMPFLICCGGYSVNGATNKPVSGTLSFIIIAPGHVTMPERIASRVINEASK